MPKFVDAVRISCSERRRALVAFGQEGDIGGGKRVAVQRDAPGDRMIRLWASTTGDRGGNHCH